MNSSLAKVLHPLAGRPLVLHVAAAAQRTGASPIAVVVGHQAEAVREALAVGDFFFALQAEQLGTGHAASMGLAALEKSSRDVLLLCGDVPLLRPETLKDLISLHRSRGAAATLLTADVDNPQGYGRVIRGEGGEVLEIVEDADATEAQRAVREINSGTYVFDLEFLSRALPEIRPGNRQGEYYLTDVVALAVAEGRSVQAVSAPHPQEALGVNDPGDLARAEAILARREEAGPGDSQKQSDLI
jgi:bifunctional UDP-N-acetylglucosamine pyrophosphorylase/glucosamine-1-phosphate N-acetyltransferase